MPAMIFYAVKNICICITIAVISISIYDMLWNVGDNKCRMTWMYEWPEYIKVNLPQKVQMRYPKYSLFIYGEGVYARYLEEMEGKYRLEGIPVIFVHGNAGRYKQVRSPASVSLRKSENSKYHFNYFTVDYEEELSALHGPYLREQTQFLYHCIVAILQCYSHLKVKPESVIAIGHSMGGLVIRGLFTLPEFDPSLVIIIINLVTPQIQPPIALDDSLSSYYDSVNRFWSLNSNKVLKNVTVVSLGGGVRDYLVRSDLCSLNTITSNNNHISMLTTDVPLVWRATDHQCIVWCNELVRLITRKFFKMIDDDTGYLTADPVLRTKLVRKFFYNEDVHSSSIRYYSDCSSIHVTANMSRHFSQGKECFYVHNNSLELGMGDVTNNSQGVDYKEVNIWVKGEVSKWMFTCTYPFEICTSTNVTEQILPSKNGAVTFISMKILPSNILLLKFTKKVHFYLQQRNKRTPALQLPLFLAKDFVVTEETFHACFNLLLLTETWQVYDVTVDFGSVELDFVVGNINVPWSGENKYVTLDSLHPTIQLKIFHRKPTSYDSNVKLQIWGDNLTNLKFTVKRNIVGSLGQLTRFNAEVIIQFTLIFGLLRLLIHESIKLLCSRAKLSKIHYVILTFVFLKVTLVLCSSVDTISLWLTRWIIPKTYVLTLSLVTAELLRNVLKIALILITCICYPIRLICRPLQKTFDSKRYFCVGRVHLDLVVILLLLPLVLTYYFERINAGILLMIITCCHVFKVQIVKDDVIKELHKTVLFSIFPVIIAFSGISIITLVKDIVAGFDTKPVSFLNLYVLTCSYTAYLLTDFENYSWKIGTNVVSLVMLLVFVLVVLSTLSLGPLYWIVYATGYLLVIFIFIN